jgi:hypothetical protein
MRGGDKQQEAIFSYIAPEKRVPVNILCGRFARWWMRF